MAPRELNLSSLFVLAFLFHYSSGGDASSKQDPNLGFLEEPEDAIGGKGKSATLRCLPRRNDSKVIWFHDGYPLDLENDTRRQIRPDGSLHFFKLVNKRPQSDQGEYRCVISSSRGLLSSRTAFLQIAGLAKNFSENPETQRAEEGANVRLNCRIESVPIPNYVWEKDGTPLRENPQKFIVFPDLKGGSVLYILNVTVFDSGIYRCVAGNSVADKMRHSLTATVTVAPRSRPSDRPKFTFLSSAFSDVTNVTEGDDVTLDCVADAFPAPNLIWSFLSSGLGQERRNTFNSSRPGLNVLRIRNVTRKHSGLYTCSPATADADALPSQTTTLVVKTFPEFHKLPNSSTFQSSRTVRLHCDASGVPVPDISWMKDGRPVQLEARMKLKSWINESRNSRMSELLFSNTVSDDAGVYQCISRNSVGNNWTASVLTLNKTKPSPDPPVNVSCVTRSSTEIKVSWDAHSHLLPEIIAYSIHYGPVGEEQTVNPTNNRSVALTKLLPFTNYSISIRTYAKGASDYSREIYCQTEEEVPISAPNFTLESTSPNSIRVSWNPLPKEKARGSITQYKIQWKLEGSPSSNVRNVSGSVFNYTIAGLTTPGKYHVRVVGKTSKGAPDSTWESIEIPGRSRNSGIPPVPTVEIEAVGSSAIRVKWNISGDAANFLEGFKIYYRKQNGGEIGPVKVSSNVTQYLITNLDPKTHYEVMVLGYSKDGDGEVGVGSIHTLKTTADLEFEPEPPVDLQAIPASPTSIDLKWSPSRSVPDVTARIVDYTVCYNPVQTSLDANTSNINCLQSSTNQILVTDLTVSTSYEFQVKSNYANRKQSDFSQTVECSTLEDVPSEVLGASFEQLNGTAFTLSWKEPLQTNGIIRNYTVSYSQDSRAPLASWNKKIVSGKTYKTDLTDLEPNGKYYVVIQASTNAGLGSPGNRLELTTEDATKSEVPNVSKDKQNDHSVGIIVGLAIGFACIMICTLCIVCRRRCVKRQVPPESETTSSGRHVEGTTSHGSRQPTTESHEMECFTYLSSQTGRNDPSESTPQHVDTKGHHPNGFVNEVRLSLTGGDGRNYNGSHTRKSINITENPRYDPNSSDSPLLGLQNLSCRTAKDSNVPLLTGKRKFSKSERSSGIGYEDSESDETEETKTDSGHPFLNKSPGNFYSVELLKNNNKFLYGENYCNPRLNENGRCLNKSHILENPEFRFSDSNTSDKSKSKRNGYYAFCNGTTDENTNQIKHLTNDIN